MAGPTGYSEIPGVYTSAPRPLAVVRRSLRNYRWGLVVTAAAILVLLFAGVVSLLVSSSQGEQDTAVPLSASPSAPPSASTSAPLSPMEASMSALLGLTWPRRDCTWYYNRWDAAKFNQGTSYKQQVGDNQGTSYRQPAGDNQETSYRQPAGDKLPQGPQNSRKSRQAPQGLDLSSLRSTNQSHASGFFFGENRIIDTTYKPNLNAGEKTEPKTGMEIEDRENGMGIEDRGNGVGILDGGNEGHPMDDHWLVSDGSTFPDNDTFYWNRNVGNVTVISATDLQDALAAGGAALMQQEELAQDIASRNLTLKEGSPPYRHQKLFRKTSPRVLELSRRGMRMTHATHFLRRRLNLSTEAITMEGRWMTPLHGIPHCDPSGGHIADPRDFTFEYFSHRPNESPVLELEETKKSTVPWRQNENLRFSRGKPSAPDDMKNRNEENSEPLRNQNEKSRISSGESSKSDNSKFHTGKNLTVRRYRVHRDCVGQERYRTADGSCNNLEHPHWGAAFTPYRRSLPPHYSDGVAAPRLSVSGDPLPSPHIVSKKVHLPHAVSSPSFTHLAMVWGQFVDHDITATAQTTGHGGSTITCCSPPVLEDQRLRHPECLPITASEAGSPPPSLNASVEAHCMEFVRSAPAPSCYLGPREQLNQVTAFLDGSVIYGSTESQTAELRLHQSGLLKTQVTVDGRDLPSPDFSSAACTTPEQAHYNRHCFKSGDSRVNEHVLLTSLHVVLTRQHNRVALQLGDLNPHWGDERLFQETRRIVGAQMQHITYHEYLPSILGRDLTEALQLLPQLPVDYVLHHQPGVANAFAAAAYRFGHSMIQGLVQKVTEDGREIGFEQLQKSYFSPYALYDVGALASLVRGSVSQSAAAVDAFFTKQVTQHLYERSSAAGGGLDLVAVNLQRGRDHGLPSYVRWRMWCGLSPVSDFSDLLPDMDAETLQRIAAVYRHVEDVDLYTGGLAELPVVGGAMGPTFACIVADQFLRLKLGDRFWYETDQLPQAFSSEELHELKKSSLAALLCENVEELGAVQRWPLKAWGSNNPRIPCTSSAIPTVDLDIWEEGDI